MASGFRALYRFATRPLTFTARRMSTVASTGADAPFLVTPGELSKLRSIPDKNVVTLDASWHMPNSPRNARKEFAESKIPGSRFIDLDEVASPHELGLKHMMPSPEQFAKACGEAIITTQYIERL